MNQRNPFALLALAAPQCPVRAATAREMSCLYHVASGAQTLKSCGLAVLLWRIISRKVHPLIEPLHFPVHTTALCLLDAKTGTLIGMPPGASPHMTTFQAVLRGSKRTRSSNHGRAHSSLM